MLLKISEFLMGAPLCVAILAVGIYLSIKLKFIQFRKLKDGFKVLFKSDGKGSVSAASALLTSLAAMLGTGNIVGVASAVHLGGAGALFWMIVSSVFGMAISYAEGYFAIEHRKIKSDGRVLGGAFLYIESCLGKIPAKFYSLCLVLAALLGIGTMTQSNSIALAFCDLYRFSGNTAVIAIAVTLISGFILFGGIERISGASTVIVPVMGAVYIIGTCTVIFVFRENLPSAVGEIFSSAFSLKAGAGGILGAALKFGISRGIFSNEAGLGTVSVACAAAKVESPHEQGLCAMVGTFIDTTLLCTLTGLAIIVTGAHKTGADGVALTNLAYNLALPGMGKLIVSVSLILFALASIVGWSYYGEQATEYLIGERAVVAYRILYLAAVFSGAFLSLNVVWQIADITNAWLAIPNLIAICFLSKKFREKKGK